MDAQTRQEARARMLGENNPRWNGGISEYPDHATMKRNRLIRLKQCRGRCEICGSRAKGIHHLDENKSNHALDNLVVVCGKCHGVLHSGSIKSTSKFKRLYGSTLAELATSFETNIAFIHKLHKKGELTQWLAAHARELVEVEACGGPGR